MCCEGPSRRWTHVVRFHSKNIISRDGEYRSVTLLSGQPRLNNANILVDDVCTNYG